MEAHGDVKQTNTLYGKFFSWRGDLITDQLERYSAHTRNEISMLRTMIREGDNILDIGAHVGTFSVPFAVFSNRKGKVYSFEANPETYNLLLKNIQVNSLDNVIIPANAVVSMEGGLGFSASLPDRENSGTYYFKAASEDSESIVYSVNIDEWHDQLTLDQDIGLVKIDVEGAELLVLESCRKVLKQFKPVLYIEINTEALRRFGATCQDIENILSPLGYCFFRNVGPRNSNNDFFKIASLKHIDNGGSFFDLLAVHPCDSRFPKEYYLSGFSSYLYQKKSDFFARTRRFIRRLFRFAS